MDCEDWVVVVPVKGWSTAKSRLGGLSRDDRRELALAMARDTVRAVTDTPEIRSCLVVGPGEVLRDLGCHNGDDSLRGVVETTLVGQVDALNVALRRGRDVAVASGWRQVAMVVADLPGISTGALREFLQLVPETAPGFLADSSGTGTNLLASRRGAQLVPRFGGYSASRHRSAGAAELSSQCDARLRVDLDTEAHLAVARTLAGPALSLWFAGQDGKQAVSECG